ncbi:Hypothetical predicted protein [Mytilus galloprovincialis]|uniref:Integrase catalytic domain-containing protein n=1 Tax=Mytilus galloprovincialis TaxID=29158 RepID=A0A8B6CQN5_MYTGA|nr:Hypothetical predicted protein [Mytilus galloprovincialis]
MKLNDDKLEVGVTEVTYFGHVITSSGLRADPHKVQAISDMPPPSNKAEVQTILGMVNYLSKFAPNLAEITSPMRAILNKDVEFAWDQPQIAAFQKVKEILTRSPGPILSYYDPTKDLTLQVDASKYGLGAVLLQDDKPVAYASKSLTTSEINYAQIEKEMYAIVFGCTRFHQYIYGRSIRVETDHKPLVSIMKKSLLDAPARLQRMILRLQRYELDVVHLPGKCIPVADTLSRKFLSDTYPGLSDSFEAQVHMIFSSLPISDRKIEEIEKATLSDPQFDILKSVILEGWPQSRSECPAQILEFWNHRDELSVNSGIIFKGHKIVIPTSLRVLMLDKIHTGHMGVEKCIRRARDVLFWPKMSLDISDMVLKCSVCLERRNSNAKEPLEPHKIPQYPWQVVATDLFYWNNADYIIIVDYYSLYLEVHKLHGTTSTTVINKLKGTFSRLGIPETVVSDNGPQYSSQEFSEFANKWDFKHVTSSPHYPQSNGLAEKTVQTVKNMFNKCKKDGKDPYVALLEYRTTPLDIGYTPSQLLMCRKLRSVLPTTLEELVPKTPIYNEVQNKIDCKKSYKKKKYYDKGSKPLKSLNSGDSVRIRGSNGLWKPAIISSQHPASRSYIVESQDGGIYRRNRRHIIGTREEVPLTTVENDTIVPPVRYEPQCNLTPPELAEPTSNINNSPQITSDTETTETQQIPSDGLYITRSGRIVKPKIIESM